MNLVDEFFSVQSVSNPFNFEYRCLAIDHLCTIYSSNNEWLYFIYLSAGKVNVSIHNDIQTLKSQEYSFVYLNTEDQFSLEVIEDAQIHIVKILPQLLLDRLVEVCCFIERIQDHIESKETCFLIDEPIKCNSHILQLFSEVENVKHKSSFQKYFLDACGLKLLGVFLEHQDRLKEDCGHIRPVDMNKMSAVRQLIEENIQNPLLISELAKEVGTNVAYLKQHFKETYGTTIYGYTLKYRMELSQKLLNDSQYTITDIAYQVGYKHATHFTQAFKKYFGQLPNSIRNRSSI